jgi:hypothetical protein
MIFKRGERRDHQRKGDHGEIGAEDDCALARTCAPSGCRLLSPHRLATRAALRHSTCCDVASEMTMWSSMHSISSSKPAGIGAAMRCTAQGRS